MDEKTEQFVIKEIIKDKLVNSILIN